METIEQLIAKNGLVFAFLFVGVIMWISYVLSHRLTRGKIPGAAIAIAAGLGLAYLGGKKGIADIPLFAGVALLGGSTSEWQESCRRGCASFQPSNRRRPWDRQSHLRQV